MPNIEKMAKAGLTFDHAFSNAPGLLSCPLDLGHWHTGPQRGFQYHRKSALAKGVKPWTALLRKAGYYCANNSKTDYNFHAAKGEAWNESSRKASWRKRPDKSAPFFYMQSFGACHESSLHFPAQLMQSEKTKTPVDRVKLHPVPSRILPPSVTPLPGILTA